MRYLLGLGMVAALAWTGCGGGGGSSSSPQVAGATPTPTAAPTSAAAARSLQTAYQQAPWSSSVTVRFPTTCAMTISTTGVPSYHADYYLAPAGAGETVVATTAVTKTQLAVIQYHATNIAGTSQTFNVCPTKAATTTAAGLGPIGYMITGEALFNPYEANGSTPALSDNASFTFTVNGVSQTASFIDGCNSHAAAMGGSSLWHYHAVPTCVTSQIDGASGPSHLIGIALDGFPIYGGRDVNGTVVPVSQLDACNGITSPTPEFPNGVYHYVLPIGVTGSRSSLTCFSGTVSQSVAAQASRYICGYGALVATADARRRGKG